MHGIATKNSKSIRTSGENPQCLAGSLVKVNNAWLETLGSAGVDLRREVGEEQVLAGSLLRRAVLAGSLPCKQPG